jgi:crotonobetainyl-CoA:carnitine CoA-transferase CaiB-like acyl-CoA transferase
MRGHGPSKDGFGLWWKEISRNKRAIGLDVSTPEGAGILRRLAASADVMVESFRPGTLERWGLDPEDLLVANPRLVIVRISGFGQTGPYAARAGFGTLAEAMSGFAHLTGSADGPPTLPAFGLADSICGIAASSAASMALLHRERTGRGQIVELNLLQPIMTAVGPGPTEYQQLGTVPARTGNRSTNNAPRNTYVTSDGHWVAISTSSQNIAERVISLVGHPEVISEPWFADGRGRVRHADELDSMVAEWIGARTRDDVLERFYEVGAAIAPVYDSQDLAEDEHILGTGMLVEVDDPDLGPLLQHGVLWRMSETPGAVRATGHALGADTDEVLGEELGMSGTDIAKLRAERVVS